MTSAPTNTPERRRRDRVGIVLQGRYMLENGAEFPCETVDVSPNGIAIRGLKVGAYGERVVAYIQDLGRIEGFIVRRAIGWFALDIRAPENKVARLDDRISWVTDRALNGKSDRRAAERVEVEDERTTLRTLEGVFIAELVDVSIEGAALITQARPRIGEAVILGEQTAYVARLFEGGVAVSFEPPADIQQSAVA